MEEQWMFEKSLERQFVIVPTGMSDPENGVSGRKNKKKQTPTSSQQFQKKKIAAWAVSPGNSNRIQTATVSATSAFLI